jgi:hypothetical protein
MRLTAAFTFALCAVSVDARGRGKKKDADAPAPSGARYLGAGNFDKLVYAKCVPPTCHVAPWPPRSLTHLAPTRAQGQICLRQVPRSLVRGLASALCAVRWGRAHLSCLRAIGEATASP